MPGTVLDKPQTRIIGEANLGNRLSVAELKSAIHDSGIAYIAIEMAKSGKRPLYDQESDTVTWEELSEAAHVDMIKFIVKKVLPDSRDYPTVEEQSLDKWANIIAAESVKGKK